MGTEDNMKNESLDATNAGLGQREVQRLPYHSPKFVSLGPIQALVQATAFAHGDGNGFTDGTANS